MPYLGTWPLGLLSDHCGNYDMWELPPTLWGNLQAGAVLLNTDLPSNTMPVCGEALQLWDEWMDEPRNQ
jgi:hypothetical protein